MRSVVILSILVSLGLVACGKGGPALSSAWELPGGPGADLPATPGGDVSSPRPDVPLPDADLPLPDVEVPLPDADLPPQDVDVSLTDADVSVPVGDESPSDADSSVGDPDLPPPGDVVSSDPSMDPGTDQDHEGIAPDDGDLAACEAGAVQTVPCGPTGQGLMQQTCVGGQWQDGSCTDPSACVDGTERTQPCGLNGRGTATETCADGQWVPDPCQDPDVCTDGVRETTPCGEEGAGQQWRVCQSGAWVPEGACSRPGRWRCVKYTCTPSFGDAACGNGKCEAKTGESRTSCPADCNFDGQLGEDKPCKDAFDCVFYPWPKSGPGFWECAGLFNRKCHAYETKQFCGTDGMDYCHFELMRMETGESCPEDCVPGNVNCGSDGECIFKEWPAY